MKKKFDIKVLLITGSYPPMKCGVGDYSYNLAKAIAAVPNVRVAVLTSAFDRTADINDKIEVFPVIKKWRLTETIKAVKIIYRWSPDVVHIQYPTQGYGSGYLPWALPIILFLMGKKVVQTWHEGYNNWRLAVRLFLKAIVPDVLIIVHPSYKERLSPKFRWALWLKKSVFIPIASNIPVIDMTEAQKNTLKQKYLKKQTRLIVFFGFVYPSKGVELLFEIADPASDYIVIAGEFGDAGGYKQKIIEQASTSLWMDKVAITGFLPSDSISELLTVADAVILPFRGGQGECNRGSVYAAVTHKTFVITTSTARNGYDQKHNIYYAKIDDVQEMKSALCSYAGRRREKNAEIDKDEWQDIANKHIKIYKQITSI
ncbi:MAG: glycosyltransferase [Sedimentisphaerales bacterium]